MSKLPGRGAPNGDSCTRTSSADPATTGVGPVVAGAAARAAAEPELRVDLPQQLSYWSENFSRRHYVRQGQRFDDYEPAYRYGVDACGSHPQCSFDDIAHELSND